MERGTQEAKSGRNFRSIQNKTKFPTCVQKNIFHVKKDMEQNKIGFEASWRELFENLRYKGGKT